MRMMVVPSAVSWRRCQSSLQCCVSHMPSSLSQGLLSALWKESRARGAMKLGWVGLFLFILLIHGWAFIYTPGPARSWHRNRGGAATLRAHGLGVGRPGGVKLLGVTQGNKERSIGASCQGDASAEPTFSELYRDELPPWLFNRVEDLGFVHPTTVQTKALKAVIAGEDVVLQAQTGSGKTLAFMLPLLAGIDSKKKAVQALVVVPSRELGLQVASVAKRLAAGRVLCRDEEDDDAEGATMGDGGAADTQQQQEQQGSEKILIMSLLEGSKNRRQRAWARAEPPHVVIGNPLALSNLVAHNGIKYNQVKLVVVDEVDACLLQQETRAQLHALLAKYLSPSYLTAELEEEAENGPKEGFTESFFKPWKLARRQTVFCSATIPQHNHFIKQCMQQQWTLREPVHIQVTPGELIPSCLKHKYLTCPSKDHKVMALRSLLKREGPRLRAAIVFTASEEDADDIAAAIEGIDDAHGVAEGGAAAELTGSSKESRQVRALLRSDHIKRRAGIMDDFRAGVTRILVATDYAARGLDVPEVSHVIMYDIPTDADTYLHRGGRAGRMGREGFVISIVSESEGFALLRLANSLSIDVKRMGAVRAASSARRSR